MKKMFLVTFSVLGLASIAISPFAATAAVFRNGSTVDGNTAATRLQQTGSSNGDH